MRILVILMLFTSCSSIVSKYHAKLDKGEWCERNSKTKYELEHCYKWAWDHNEN